MTNPYYNRGGGINPHTTALAEVVTNEFYKIEQAFAKLPDPTAVGTGGGAPNYTHYAYADSPDGTANFTTGPAGNRAYVGVATNQPSPTPSEYPEDYRWSRMRGGDSVDAITGYLTKDTQTVPADPSGNTLSYAGASGDFVIIRGTTDGFSDISAAFVLSTVSNPQSLTVNYIGNAFAITGGLDQLENVATLVIRATGIGAYAGVTIDKTFTLTKVRNGADGSASDAGITAYLTREAVALFAYADGTVSSYMPAAGNFKVFAGTTDASDQFTLSTQANPQGLTMLYTGQGYAVTGGFDANEDTASVTIRATGSGAYAGVVLDKILSLSKAKGGYEIVDTLPGSNLFNGRIVFLTSDGKLYRYVTGTGWTAAVPTVDLVGQITNGQIASLAAGKLTGTITNTQIGDNQITSPKLAANSVSSKHLIVGSKGQNLVANPGAEDGTVDGWTAFAGSPTFTATAGTRRSGALGFRVAKASASDGAALTCKAMPVTPGKTYVVRASAFVNVNAPAGFYLRVFAAATPDGSGYVTDANRTNANYMLTDIASGEMIEYRPLTTSWKDWEATWTCPAGCNWASIGVYFWTEAAPATIMGFDNVEFFEQVVSAVIGDGQIVTPKLAASVVTADKLATNSVTADKIMAGEVTGAKLAATNIITNSAQIGDGLITNAKIGNAAITSAKIGDLEVDSAKIANLTIGTGKIEAEAISRVYTVNGSAIIAMPGSGGIYTVLSSAINKLDSSSLLEVYGQVGFTAASGAIGLNLLVQIYSGGSLYADQWYVLRIDNATYIDIPIAYNFIFGAFPAGNYTITISVQKTISAYTQTSGGYQMRIREFLR